MADNRLNIATGWAIAALAPAVFWSILITLAASALDIEPTFAIAGGIALAVALFLSLVYAALALPLDKTC